MGTWGCVWSAFKSISYCWIRISGPLPLDKIELFDLSGRLVFSENRIGASYFELPKGSW